MYMPFQIISFAYAIHTEGLISSWETSDNWKTATKYTQLNTYLFKIYS